MTPQSASPRPGATLVLASVLALAAACSSPSAPPPGVDAVANAEISGADANPPCDDGDPCTADFPAAGGGCGHSPEPCLDDDLCTLDGCTPGMGCLFLAGKCADGDPCTEDGCDTQIGCVFPQKKCLDGDTCTDDICVAGACQHPVASNLGKPCGDGDVCADGTCVEASCSGVAEPPLWVVYPQDTEAVAVSPDGPWLLRKVQGDSPGWVLQRVGAAGVLEAPITAGLPATSDATVHAFRREHGFAVAATEVRSDGTTAPLLTQLADDGSATWVAKFTVGDAISCTSAVRLADGEFVAALGAKTSTQGWVTRIGPSGTSWQYKVPNSNGGALIARGPDAVVRLAPTVLFERRATSDGKVTAQHPLAGLKTPKWITAAGNGFVLVAPFDNTTTLVRVGATDKVLWSKVVPGPIEHVVTPSGAVIALATTNLKSLDDNVGTAALSLRRYASTFEEDWTFDAIADVHFQLALVGADNQERAWLRVGIGEPGAPLSWNLVRHGSKGRLWCPPPVAPQSSCGPGEFHYLDQLCGLPPPGKPPVPCKEMGDGACYKLCTQDADCIDPAAPKCVTRGLYAQGDYNCNKVVRFCAPAAMHMNCL